LIIINPRLRYFYFSIIHPIPYKSQAYPVFGYIHYSMKRFWEDLFRAFRATSVLVATLVGAGYATGREMSQYFGSASYWTLVFAAVLIALFSMAFLYVGHSGRAFSGKFVCFYRIALSILAVVSCGVMVAASKSLLGGTWTPILICIAGVCICFTDKVFHFFNVLAVPVLLLLVAVVAFAAENVAVGTAFLPLSAANYAGMNLLFEGELLREEGKGMRPRAIVMSGVFIAVCMFLLLAAMHSIVGAAPSELPFADVAEGLGLRHVAQGVILVSILSSIAGGMRVTLTVWQPRLSASLAALLALLLALSVSIVSFANLVKYVYPVLGWLGVAVVVAYVLAALGDLLAKRGEMPRLMRLSERFNRKNRKKRVCKREKTLLTAND